MIQPVSPRGRAVELTPHSATGACACVGLMGPGLGGGFGRYQGFYGLIADNILELTVVTADGSIVTAGPNENQDLFWAMGGAGHNFGIVTRVKYKTYDDPAPDWWIASYQFTRGKLDQVFDALNQINGNGSQPKELTTYTFLAFDQAVSDEVRPLIILTYFYRALPLFSDTSYKHSLPSP